jgi:hypothetical protein
MQWLTKARHWLAFGLILVACFLALQKFADYTLVRISIASSHTTTFKVYWTTQAVDSWAESNSVEVQLNNRKNAYILPLPIALSKIKRLRIDPNAHTGIETRLFELSLYHLYTRSITFGGRSKEGFNEFIGNEQTGKPVKGAKLRVKSTGDDPAFEINLAGFIKQLPPWLIAIQAFLLALLGYGLLMRSSALFIEQLRWVPIGMLFAATAVMVMASVSKYNSHPDEFSHIANARYYQDHYVPPPVCLEETRNTYSDYGVSRLDKREIAYYIGGRYLQLVAAVPVRDFTKLRYLNVGMFFFLVLIAFRRVKARILFLPLLLTPQAWYLFSYYNSDALSLFVVMLTAYQIFVPKSMLRRLMIGERPPAFILWVLCISLIFAMLYWLKLNYTIYVLFIFALGASWWLLNRRLPDLRSTLPLWIAFVLGTSLFLSWEVSRHAINDYALADRVMDCREQLAKTIYKPSTPLVKTHGNYRLKAKGYTAKDLIVKLSWPERIFYTGLGTYGYTEYLNSYYIFGASSAFILLLFFYVCVTIAIKGGSLARLAVLSTVGAICTITLAAFWMNWSRDFQPQGRYLMVYLPLFGSLLAMYDKKLNLSVLSALAAVPFFLAVYSFFAVALVEIPK